MVTHAPARERATLQSIVAAAATFDVPASIAEPAALNVITGRAVLIGMSGKLASGKDTIAPLVLDALGYTRRTQVAFADPLRDEQDEVYGTIRSWAAGRRDIDLNAGLTPAQRAELAEVLARIHRIPYDIAEREFTGAAAVEVIADVSITSRRRTAASRRVQQVLGTDVRRAQDLNYWVRPAVRRMLEVLADPDGVSVYLTDNRYANEILAAQSIGGLALRLDVTPETQRKRLFDRDGVWPDPAALAHPSEVEMDTFAHFDARVSNDGTTQETVSALLAALA